MLQGVSRPSLHLIYTSVWRKWGKGKTVRPLLCWGEQWLPYTAMALAIFPCCLLKRWTLYTLPSWPYSMLCSVRIPRHTPPSLAENLFPEQGFVFLWSHLFQHAIPTCSGTEMDASSSRDEVPSSPCSPEYPSSFHPRRWTAPVHAEPSSTFRSR